MNEVILFLKNIDLYWNSTESIAVIFSIIYVVLAAKKNIYCWLAAIISVSLYIHICFNAKLYAETGLQIFYLLMAFYGYYNWSKKEVSFKIHTWGVSKHLSIIITGALLTFIIGFYFATYTSAKLPIIDSFTTVFSIFATYMVVKKVLENWLYWIIIDIVSIHLYYNRDLHLTSILFFTYTIIAVFGYVSWLKQTKLNV